MLGGYRADIRVTHWLSQPGPSSLLQLPQKLFLQDSDAPALASLSQRGLSPSPAPSPHHTQHSCPHSVLPSIVSLLSARGQIHPAPGRAAPGPSPCTNQPVSHPQHPKRICHPVPHPKNQAGVPGLFREGVLGQRVLAPEMSPTPREGSLWAR